MLAPTVRHHNMLMNILSRTYNATRSMLPSYVKKQLYGLISWLCKTKNTHTAGAIEKSFHFENRAVSAGISAHRATENALDNAKKYLLRRAIHRIEKGLISRPRRDVFAADYIEDTVDMYCSGVALTASDPDKTLQTWSGDVLDRYFSVVSSNENVDRARNRYAQYLARHPRIARQAAPYIIDRSPLRINYADMLSLAKRRRSVRHYLQKPVPRELIDNALVVAGYSPSACNRQPFVFRVFDEPELVRKISSIPMGTKGFYEEFPCIVVIVGQLRAFKEMRDRHLIYIDGSLAAMSFLYALEVQGLSSCCINWPEIPELEERMISSLNLAPDERPIMLISLGYPDPEAQVPYSQKKPLNELRIYNQ
jgi:nitroreductase